MPNDFLSNVSGLARSFISIAVYEEDPLVAPDNVIPHYLAASNRCEGFAIALIRLQNEEAIAFAALILATMAAKESRIRRLCLMGITYSKYQSVEDILVAAALDPDERLRRLALEASIYRKSSKLNTLCDLLTSDTDPELVQLSIAAKNGAVIPFVELESAEALGLREVYTPL